MPFWISFTIRTFSWIHILGEQGVINVTLLQLGLIDEPMPMLYTEGAVIMGLVHFLLPYMILNVYVSLEGIDRNLISAARSLGCTSAQAFREVTLPLSLPGLVAGLLLCFVLAAGSYVTPQMLGVTPRCAVRQSHLRHDHGAAQLADGRDAVDRAVRRCSACVAVDLQPLHGPVADLQGAWRDEPRRRRQRRQMGLAR